MGDQERRGKWWMVLVALGGLFLFGALASSCGGEAYIGESCRYHSDCPGDTRCLTGDRFPGGTCATSCDDHHDCPSFAYCIDREGGVCLPGCDRDRDCRANYECSDERNHGHGGRSNVCIGD